MTTLNRGTGAGGAATNHNGLAFEEKTNNGSRLLASGFNKVKLPGGGKYAYYLEGTLLTGIPCHFVTQGGLKSYIQEKFKKTLWREPDEAYILNPSSSTPTICILEKKNQNTAGSVDTKLALASYFISEYKSVLPTFTIRYAFCVSDFLKKEVLADTPKARHLREWNSNIPFFFGDDADYFTKLEAWLTSSPAPPESESQDS